MSRVLEFEPGVTAVSSSRRARSAVWRVLKDRPSAALGAVIIVLLVTVAVFAPFIAPTGVHERIGPPFGTPAQYPPLGLDDGGISILTLLIYGARISLTVGFIATLVAILIGGTVGVTAGYFGGGLDTFLMRTTDYFLAIPDAPLMIVIAAIWGPSLSHIILVIGLLLWTSTARIVRSQVQSVRERVYVKRARAQGATNRRIVFRHVLPQVAPLIIANTVLTIAVAIFDETALAFLGLSDPSKTSWGKMIYNAVESSAMSAGAWWAIVPPGICVAVLVLACTLVGQAMEDSLNPRLRVAHLAAKGFRLIPRVTEPS